MTAGNLRQYLYDHPGHYLIRVIGALEPRWLDQLQDLEIRTGPWGSFPEVTQISGWLEDQPALGGLLELLNDLGRVILTVERLEVEKDIE